MVAHSGTTLRADRLRPLNRPRPIRVKTDERGAPVAVLRLREQETGDRGQELRVAYPCNLSPVTWNLVWVAEILDRWRIDDEWWRPALTETGPVGRAEISRMYYHVALENRQLLVIFQDLVGGRWYAQTTASPMEQPEPLHVLAPHITNSTGDVVPGSEKAPIRRVGSSANAR